MKNLRTKRSGETKFLHFVKSYEMKQRMIVHHLQNEINQSIVSAKIRNSIIEKGETRKSVISKHCREIEKSLGKAVQDIHAISSLIYPLQLDNVGFKNAIEDARKKIITNKKINVQINYDIYIQDLTFEVKIILYRIIENLFINLSKNSSFITINIFQQKAAIAIKASWNINSHISKANIDSLFSELGEYISLLKGRLHYKLFPDRTGETTIRLPYSGKYD